jgi:23S rRNA (cytosine1962-C5)-methyltransferase
MVRIISFEERAIDQDFWNEKIQAAYQLREALGLTSIQKQMSFGWFTEREIYYRD